uniref:Uncharacterized protein n=1 Tax=Moniliophthora roreri TaxID=221103 RepID=A0A0W0GAK7_MONRR
MLFGMSVQILCKRNQERPNEKLYLGWTVTLFVLATITNGFQAWLMIQQQIIFFEAAETREYDRLLRYLLGEPLKTVPITLLSIGALVINIVADTMLIHRCWIIWGTSKRVALPLMLMSLGTNIFGIVFTTMGLIGQSDTTVASNAILLAQSNRLSVGYTVGNIIVNSTITLMTAGRIWWISRQARAVMGQPINAKYKTIVAIILESGILYPLTLVVQIIIYYTTDPTGSGRIPVDLGPVVWQFAGIAPTLIIVRAEMGKTVDSVHQQVSSLRFAVGDQDARRSNLHAINITVGEQVLSDKDSGFAPYRSSRSIEEMV